MKELYTAEVMAHAANIPLIGELDSPDGVGEAHSKLCGSKIKVYLRLDPVDGRVTAFAQEVKACLMGQTSASILAKAVIGLSRADLAGMREQVRAMLEDEGSAPEGVWADFALLIPVRNYRSRIATVLLPFDATLRAIDQALARQEV